MVYFLPYYLKILNKNTGHAPSLTHTQNCDSVLDVSDVKDVSAKWERSNMSPDIYYMC